VGYGGSNAAIGFEGPGPPNPPTLRTGPGGVGADFALHGSEIQRYGGIIRVSGE